MNHTSAIVEGLNVYFFRVVSHDRWQRRWHGAARATATAAASNCEGRGGCGIDVGVELRGLRLPRWEEAARRVVEATTCIGLGVQSGKSSQDTVNVAAAALAARRNSRGPRSSTQPP
uniref:Uncharacterized protein n=1 Tax=Oryza sativa subsp. japonica TaxID=39947 RepID=Q654E8_ORYSJ|nr:hypothetical protein [Oryza sativa Japonica Group]BAD61680.1 hypothetical protein [Oryza sativa Japonica Group]